MRGLQCVLCALLCGLDNMISQSVFDDVIMKLLNNDVTIYYQCGHRTI